MKEMARFEIYDYQDRNTVCSILASAGYPVVIKNTETPTGQRDKSFVVVYEKEDAK